MALEHVGERGVDRLEQRVDRAVALGGGSPVVIAGLDDDGAAALDVAARGDRPARQVERGLVAVVIGRRRVAAVIASPPRRSRW